MSNSTAALDAIFHYRQISQQFSSSGAISAEQLQDLADSGVEVLVNLLPDRNADALHGESTLAAKARMAYHHIPVDFAAPKPEEFQRFAEIMDGISSERCHIHCAANYRASAFYACYAEQRGWWSRAEAQAFIEGIWQPEDWLPWPRFIAACRSEA